LSFRRQGGILRCMAWWQRPKIESPTVRIAQPTDRPMVADLLDRAVRQHGTHAVEDQMSLLSSSLSSLAVDGERSVGFFGLRERASADGEHWADLALIAISANWEPDKGVRALLAHSLPALGRRGVTGVVCLTAEPWLQDALRAAGFGQVDRVITYVRNNRPVSAYTPVAMLRAARSADAATVLRLNAAAFAPIWRYDEATTLSWLLTAEHPVLADDGGQAVAFALTGKASADGYAQLIRLGTHPEWQGRGIGRQLVIDAINFGHRTGALGVALNTQYSNVGARHLYESLGFRAVGHGVDVFTYSVQ
jgi:ribosomal protein S18 acetylase RimI-like enzyme